MHGIIYIIISWYHLNLYHGIIYITADLCDINDIVWGFLCWRGHLLDEEPLLLVCRLPLQTGNPDWTTERPHNLPVWLDHFLFKNNNKQISLKCIWQIFLLFAWWTLHEILTRKCEKNGYCLEKWKAEEKPISTLLVKLDIERKHFP